MNRTPCGLVTTSPIVSGLFPPGIVATAVRGDVYPRDLYPEEAEIVETAAPKRQREFAAGRLCARLALSELGIHGFPLTVASNRSALWPHGVVGSITHTSGFCAAVVGCGRALGGLGIDAERCGRIGPDLMPRICTP